MMKKPKLTGNLGKDTAIFAATGSAINTKDKQTKSHQKRQRRSKKVLHNTYRPRHIQLTI